MNGHSAANALHGRTYNFVGSTEFDGFWKDGDMWSIGAERGLSESEMGWIRI